MTALRVPLGEMTKLSRGCELTSWALQQHSKKELFFIAPYGISI
jgi:hypothetical protein